MIALLLLAACGPDTGDTTLDLDCLDGFGRAADGMCYPLDLDTGDGSALVEATCSGDSTHYAAVDVGGPVEPDAIEAWGYIDQAVVDVCKDYASIVGDPCNDVPESPGWALDASGAVVDDDGAVSVRCLHYVARIDGLDPLEGFVTSPIRLYITVN